MASGANRKNYIVKKISFEKQTDFERRKELNFENYKQVDRQMNPRFSREMRDIIAKGADEEDLRKPIINGSPVKVVISGHVVEVYEYEKPVKNGDRLPASEYVVDEETGEILNRVAADQAENKKQNSRRAKMELRRLILSNFDASTDKFFTLTFRDGTVNDVKNVRECGNEFRKFHIRMKERFNDYKYVKVIEFQDKNDRGAVHYHVLAKLPYIKSSDLEEIWGNGFVKITKIHHVDNLGAYVSKYMVKDFSDMRLFGEKAYTTSRGNLIRPITLYGSEALEIIANYLQGKKEVFANSYESEYQGKITYKEYNLKRF